MDVIVRLSLQDIESRLRPRHKQLARLIDGLGFPRLQEQAIAEWNETGRLPMDLMRLPRSSRTGLSTDRREAV